MSDEHAPPDFARQNGWDRQYNVFVPPEIPTYVGPVSFCNRPWLDTPEALFERRPDVAIVHVQRADRSGNAQVWGIVGEQKEAAFASKNRDSRERSRF
jgi:hypothetical protein